MYERHLRGEPPASFAVPAIENGKRPSIEL
jgi:hypothetical protein